MIFIPSKDGISHSPKEYSSPEDIANGAEVLNIWSGAEPQPPTIYWCVISY